MIQTQSQPLQTQSDGTLTPPAALNSPIFVATYAPTTTTIDARNSNLIELTLTATLTNLNITNLPNGEELHLFVIQDATGSRLITNIQVNGATSNVLWAGGSAPTLTTTAGHSDELIFTYSGTINKARARVSANYAG